jgi:hypothetical protein
MIAGHRIQQARASFREAIENHCKAALEQLGNPEARRILLEVAENYERIAMLAEVGAVDFDVSH